MRTERQIPGRFTDASGSVLVGRDEIGRTFEKLLCSENPVASLSRICSNIPQKYSLVELSKLHCEGKLDCLVFACLPTLNSILSDFTEFSELGTDLVEEGLVCLLRTISKWNPSTKSQDKGPVPLKQFVGNETRRKLEELVTRRYGLRNRDDFPLVKLFQKCWDDFIIESGRPPRLEEINFLVESNNKSNFPLFCHFAGRTGKKVSKVEIMFCSAQGGLMGDSVMIVEGPRTVEEEVFQSSLERDFYLVMKVLSPREKTVLRLRYWPVGKETISNEKCAWTLEQVADYFGVDREKIRQIEAHAFRKLRRPTRSFKLRDYL